MSKFTTLLVLSLSFGAILLPSGPRARGEMLIARQVTLESAATDLFGGTDADGGVGDWYLSNGVIEAIVDNVGYQEDILQATGQAIAIQNDVAPSGGILIDLGLVGHNNDQFDSLFQLVNFSMENPIFYLPAGEALGDPSLPPVLASVDEEEGIASLTVFGIAQLGSSTLANPTVPVMTEYSLRRGESFVNIKTTITNRSQRPITILSLVDVIVMAGRGNIPFAVSPGRGFNHPEFNISDPLSAIKNYPYVSVVGRVSPEDGPAGNASPMAAGEVSYTLLSPENEVVTGVVSDLASATGSPLRPRLLRPRKRFTYERRLIVGGRNDVASGSDMALQQLSSVYGFTTGTVRGRLTTSDGLPFRASLAVNLIELNAAASRRNVLAKMVKRVDDPLPLTHLETDSLRGGGFQAVLPAGRYQLKVSSEERAATPPIEFVVAPGEITDLAPIDLPQAGHLVFHVTDAETGGIPAKITIKGKNGTVDPRFGQPMDVTIGGILILTQAQHSSPALNIVYTGDGRGDVVIRPGEYRVYASRGLEYDIDYADVIIVPGQSEQVNLTLHRVVDTRGYLSGDFHIHSMKSPDSSVPPVDRVLSFAAEGVEVMVSTDHDYIFDYQPVINNLGLSQWVTAMAGDEVTTIHSLGQLGQSTGHFNGWPLPVNPIGRKGGAPEDEFVEPNVIYDRLRSLGAEVVQLNHPQSKDNGLFGILGFDPMRSIENEPNNFLLRESILGSHTRNIDYDVMEIFNGPSIGKYLLTRLSWFSLLSQGILRAGTAVTDTHLVTLSHAGFPRTYVVSSVTDMRDFVPSEFNENLKAMRAYGTSGPFLEVLVTGDHTSAGPGGLTMTATGRAAVHVRVQAPDWIPVEEVRLFANGALVKRVPVQTPMGSVSRFDGDIEVEVDRDTFYVVETGQVLPDDPGQHPIPGDVMSIIEPGVVSLAFSNPVFVDTDGNGAFDPPGLEPVIARRNEMRRRLLRAVMDPSRRARTVWKWIEGLSRTPASYLKSLGDRRVPFNSDLSETTGWVLPRQGMRQPVPPEDQ